ncbi:hypothetical protein BS47DRAFT_1351858 [Hydnum rufescens UP504]|uniref:Uncharacterized protein n=1 Tax=Hydnum rufescens UP504 TaxID=1448309 RepID=A0A9P6DMT9_9AGAM|nr:hypothetical protein BS47DRAFT_1351858 [Hydnum rufescens UP504]
MCPLPFRILNSLTVPFFVFLALGYYQIQNSMYRMVIRYYAHRFPHGCPGERKKT